MRIGILGGGQLGRMMALAAHPLGIVCRVLDPAADGCAAVTARQITGEYDDHRALFELCRQSDVVTYEFENVPVESAEWLAERLPTFPPPRALAVAQDRVAEKTFFRDLGVTVPPFAAVHDRADLDEAVRAIGLPAVLKTVRFGYDGKGQAVLRGPADVESAWQRLGGRPLILEGMIDFDRELSILAVRGRTGEMRTYPLVQNLHRNGMLRRSDAPAEGVSAELDRSARHIAERALNALDYVGVLAVELFERRGELLVNEMAPRVHNSGHWTIEGAETSQFENHVRAVAGLPLGDTRPRGYVRMYNLIGDWPDPAALLGIEGVHLHLYGKTPRENRKVGHVTLRADSREELDRIDAAVRPILTPGQLID